MDPTGIEPVPLRPMRRDPRGDLDGLLREPLHDYVLDPTGIEPVASTMRMWRSPS